MQTLQPEAVFGTHLPSVVTQQPTSAIQASVVQYIAVAFYAQP